MDGDNLYWIIDGCKLEREVLLLTLGAVNRQVQWRHWSVHTGDIVPCLVERQPPADLQEKKICLRV